MEYPIFAKDQKDVPEWMKAHHEWQSAVDINKLPKLQLKVKLCCSKCEEKVVEEIREVHGVFDVKADRMASKVVVVTMPAPNGLDQHEVLKKAKKIHKKAKFVPLDDKEKPKAEGKKEDDKKKEEEKKTQQASIAYVSHPLIWGQYLPHPPPGEYRPSQSYSARYYDPPLPNQSEGPYRQYVYYY